MPRLDAIFFRTFTIDTDRYVYNTLDFDFLLFELQDTIKWLTLDNIKLTARLGIAWIAYFHYLFCRGFVACFNKKCKFSKKKATVVYSQKVTTIIDQFSTNKNDSCNYL